ncbi:hypothetical protein LJY18_11505 [Pseudomonas sp. MMS21-TM103]|uniref:hypothetical protein n=1 Tax=Pseudomonas sp. MMS21 TM103 TaxID=2886506 RepID=UPI001EDF1155|nr:hypothetical protein [Pseudomonas sp. MMS21 TM103]MCG4453920.1 hypothetical protein [Pseudomonas sp. MMS21 TM103]
MAGWRSWGVLALLPSLLLAARVQVPSTAARSARGLALLRNLAKALRKNFVGAALGPIA